MKEIDAETLARSDGKDGRPAYIAHKGRVIDVSQSPLWAGGDHMGIHQAGQDLSADLEGAPHGVEVLDRYTQVGMTVSQKSEVRSQKSEVRSQKSEVRPPIESLGGMVRNSESKAGEQRAEVGGQRVPGWLSGLLARFPTLRRHPHPMTVHFPIVFTLSVTAFALLYVVTGHRPFETTAFHCLCAAVIMTPVAIVTGFYTWWLNYLTRPIRAVLVKRNLSLILFAMQIAALLWRLGSPNILEGISGAGLVYLLLLIAMSPIVIILGAIGGSLTFPVKK